ncbi:RNase H domain-containing protein [Trichonephila clavipes]|uniref:RNase H domain-containing protein n=1 Tax=Trichonephila clavipes TaxID=2585209 RepID=A0A8X6S3B6_TRICX|nr:RNase H domain-containing protein [Trichonephila clavipes]
MHFVIGTLLYEENREMFLVPGKSSLYRKIRNIESAIINYVEFWEELLTSTSVHSSHPELLRQLALEVINDIPDQALIIYTDGSRLDTGRADSTIFSNTPGNDVKISIRNSDHCFVFRSELIAISGALDSYKDSIWILADSRSSIQYLRNWPKIMDSTGLDIYPNWLGLVRGHKYVSSRYHRMWV